MQTKKKKKKKERKAINKKYTRLAPFFITIPAECAFISCSFPMSVSLTLTYIIEVAKNIYIFNALCSFGISAVVQLMKSKLNEYKKNVHENDFRNAVSKSDWF